ncbi:unnamed protein product [Cylindrotheca closterium]|uniref:Uncharacterized protein n=1 Tax=Cylindrotheca closterium TaxID=2856 RepID=A0AAD2FIS2_9STRA|nr:unnamed protein product [Cylindrotheca closterium]
MISKITVPLFLALLCGADAHSATTRAADVKSHSARVGDKNAPIYGKECSIYILENSDWHHKTLPQILCGGYQNEMIIYLLNKDLEDNPCQMALDSVGFESAISEINEFHFEECIAIVDADLRAALKEKIVRRDSPRHGRAHSVHTRAKEDVGTSFFSEACTSSVLDDIGDNWHQEDLPLKLCSGYHSEMMYFLAKPSEETGGSPCQDALDGAEIDPALDFITMFRFEDCIAEVDKEMDAMVADSYGLVGSHHGEGRRPWYCIFGICGEGEEGAERP